MANQSNFPTSFDPEPTDKSSGDRIPSADWNRYLDAVYQLQQKVGIDSSAITTSLDYKSRYGNFIDIITRSPFVDVRSYGAVGDGVTDDTTAIQNAIDSITTGVVFFPTGTYKYSTKLTLKKGVSLLGSGPMSSVLYFTGVTEGLYICWDAVGTPETTIQFLQLKGPGGSTAGNYCIYAPGGTGKVIAKLCIANVLIDDWGDDGIRIQGETGLISIKDSGITDCNGYGINFYEDANNIIPVDTYIENTYIQGCLGGISYDTSVASSGFSTVTGINIELSSNTKPLIYVNNYYGLTIIKPTLSTSVTSITGNAVVVFTGSSFGCSLIGCINLATAESGNIDNILLDTNTANITISGGFYKNTTGGYFVNYASTQIHHIFLPEFSTYDTGKNIVYRSGGHWNGVEIIQNRVYGDLLAKQPWLDVRFYMDGVSGRPTYSVWAANQSTTDVTLAIQAAIDALESVHGGTLFFPQGIYLITDTLTVTSSQISFVGVGKFESIIWINHATKDGIYVYNSEGLSGFSMRHLMLHGPNSGRTSGKGLYIRYTGDYEIEHVYIRNCWDGLYLENVYTGFINDLVIDEEITDGMSNNGVTLIGRTISGEGNSSIYQDWNKVIVTANNVGFLIDGAIDTLMISNSGAQTVAKCDYGIKFENTVSGVHDPRWIWLTRFTTECATAGYYFRKGHNIELDSCYSCWGDNGVVYNGTDYTSLRALSINGGIYQLANLAGILVDGVHDLTINGAIVSDNNESGVGYPGISLAPNISNFTVIGTKSGNIVWNGAGGSGGQQVYGLTCQAGTSDNFVIVGNDFTGNVTGGLLLSGITGTSYAVWGNLPYENALQLRAQDIWPISDNAYYLGKNDDDTPYAWKGLILKDTNDGKYYRLQVTDGAIEAIDLSD